MTLRLPDRGFLVKLFYQSGNTVLVARILKGKRKGPLTVKVSNVQAIPSVRHLVEGFDMPRSTVQKIMRIILRYYPLKLQLVQEFLRDSLPVLTSDFCSLWN